MIKGWLKSMPPESLNPQGAGPGRTTFWGMVPPGAAFLGWGSVDVQRLWRSEGAALPTASVPEPDSPLCSSDSVLTRTAEELYLRSRLTSPADPPPRLLPLRRAPTLEERHAPDPREFTDAHWLGASSRPLPRALEEASSCNFHYSIKVTPVLLYIVYLELRGALHSKLKAVKSQPLCFQLK